MTRRNTITLQASHRKGAETLRFTGERVALAVSDPLSPSARHWILAVYRDAKTDAAVLAIARSTPWLGVDDTHTDYYVPRAMTGREAMLAIIDRLESYDATIALCPFLPSREQHERDLIQAEWDSVAASIAQQIYTEY